MPGTLVEIGLKELEGLGSQLSTWLCPPSSQIRMQASALAFAAPLPVVAIACRAEMYCSRFTPRKLREPTRKKSRRLACSPGLQKPHPFCFIGSTFSMVKSKLAGTDQRPHKIPQ